ncbi:NADH:flavin oxidoreductase [Ferruginivarius sediminum]|uniref:FAD-dependent oxidoreductase n=1 Tax=Ferruginivarius sediminum TaxID=2661937 RepID=A0A369TAZ4_9PROT|nr:NADH:flavin oxidoreductase [Ferruginivarius sediminum]RDD61347.1 FAD-dependent oxidoreductase [Ferruginivarius sediminum]
MARNDPLLQPFTLKHLELRNRICSTAHEPNYAENGLPTERYRLYHEEKAKGGIGLTFIGGSAVVDRDSPPAFGNLHLWDDAIVPHFRALAEGVHAHGAAVMCQITHLGRRTANMTADWLPVLSPSCVREPAHRAFPKAMEDFDIARVVRAYGMAARRCRDGGLDGIEIEAYGHLLDAFWSPMTNRRDDEYGGSLDNRLRFAHQVIAEIRRQVGADYILGIRMVVDEDLKNGLRCEEGMKIARRLTADGGVDFVNVIKGHIDTDEGLSHVIPGMGTPAAPHLELAGRVKRELGVPVLHAARINDVATARHAVAEGHVDLVGMTRAHMADPHIALKLARGDEERIRPCVGVGYCIDRIYEGGDALCIHNAATGREQSMPHVIPKAEGRAKKVVVVGAGPAGLEAARVAALRGHGVTVFEAADRPGGQVRLAAALQRRGEIMGMIDWLEDEAVRAGAELRINTFAERAEVMAEAPDVVVVATGGLPNTSFLEEGENLATTSWDVLSGQAVAGQDVLVYDDNGAHPGVTAAEYLARAGSRVHYVTPERMLSPDIGGTNYPAYFRAFGQFGVETTVNRRLLGLRRNGNKLEAMLWDDYAKADHIVPVDQVVVEHGTLPFDELYFDLKDGSANRGEVDYDALLAGRPQPVGQGANGGYWLVRIGDAVASRNIHAAIYDALRVVKDI